MLAPTRVDSRIITKIMHNPYEGNRKLEDALLEMKDIDNKPHSRVNETYAWFIIRGGEWIEIELVDAMIAYQNGVKIAFEVYRAHDN